MIKIRGEDWITFGITFPAQSPNCYFVECVHRGVVYGAGMEVIRDAHRKLRFILKAPGRRRDSPWNSTGRRALDTWRNPVQGKKRESIVQGEGSGEKSAPPSKNRRRPIPNDLSRREIPCSRGAVVLGGERSRYLASAGKASCGDVLIRDLTAHRVKPISREGEKSTL